MNPWPRARIRHALVLAPAVLLLAARVQAQPIAPAPDSTRALPEVRVEAARGADAGRAPFALAVVERSEAAVGLEPGLSLREVVRGAPGLWLGDRGHAAYGERLAVRGSGWRAAFGVRGVQVLLDGLPLTLPDGQAVLDPVEPALVRRAEVVRGPAGLFWGNGSGGAVALSTRPEAGAPPLRVRALGGAYGLRQGLAEAAWARGTHRLHGWVSGVEQDGFRVHGASRLARAGGGGAWTLGPRTRLEATAAAVYQDVENPGALTHDEASATPRLADPRSVEADAGKRSAQVQGGLTLRHRSALGTASALVWGLGRDLDNPLTFAYVGVGRTAGGARLDLTNERGPFGWRLGLDAGWQRDRRKNWANEGGAPAGEPTLDQRETAQNVAAFGHAAVRPLAWLELTAGLRADRVRLALADRLLANGDQSGRRDFTSLSPGVGASYRLGSALVFASVGSSFETPTLTELVNRPGGFLGFNPDLTPERTRGAEGGVRGTWAAARLHFDAALFYFRVRDRLEPFQTDEGGDRVFYRNGGDLAHTGVEVALSWEPRPDLALYAAGTLGRFAFQDEALRGRRVPGVPSRFARAGADFRPGRFWTSMQVELVGGYFADEANAAPAGAYAVVDLAAGHEGLALVGARLRPFARVGNLLDRRYSGSVVVGARAERYYEPAPGRVVQAGLDLSF